MMHTKCHVSLILWCAKNWNRIKLFECAVVLNVCWVTVSLEFLAWNIRCAFLSFYFFFSVEYLWRATGVSIIFSVLASNMDNNLFSFYLLKFSISISSEITRPSISRFLICFEEYIVRKKSEKPCTMVLKANSTARNSLYRSRNHSPINPSANLGLVCTDLHWVRTIPNSQFSTFNIETQICLPPLLLFLSYIRAYFYSVIITNSLIK